MKQQIQHTIDNALLKSVFLIQNPSHNRWCNDRTMDIIRGLAPAGCVVVRNRGNMIIRKGDPKRIQPYYVAHMDQVHDYEPGMSLAVDGDTLYALDGNRKQTGVGGDDKCGIYLALAMLHALDHCSAVFVRDEETGCHGSGEVPMEWFASAAFVLQADRNNRTMDVIRDTNGMICASDAFMDAILGLPTAVANEHKSNTGSVTDIGELASRKLPVSAVNISSGYHNPHQSTEFVTLSELEIACTLALEAGLTLGNQTWDHVPTSSWGGYRSTNPSVSGGGAWWGRWSGNKTKSITAPSYWGDDESEIFDSSELDFTPEEKQNREVIIKELEFYGYDRELHNLELISLIDLEDMLDEVEYGCAAKCSEEDLSAIK